jgi:hypothetical protein
MTQYKRPPHRTVVAAALPALMLAGAIFAGCGGGSGTATVASLSQHTGGSSRALQSPITPGQSDAAMVSFTSCMRSHGVQMSDPFHRPGHVGLSIDLPVQDAATRVAYGACGHILQPLIEAKQRGAAERAAPDLPALTHYAQCMRTRDINMLDPTSFGAVSLGNVPGITDNFGRYSPQFRAADAACRHLLPPSVHDDGTGP